VPAALLFDIGNVIVTFDFTLAAQRFAERSALSAEAIMAAIAPFKDPLESGQLSDADFIQQSITALGFRGNEAEFSHIWCDIFALNEPMARSLAELPAEVPAFLLSNTNGLHIRYLFEHFPIFQRFAGGVYSHEARSMKPEAAIFDQATQQLGLDPATTLYIDDLAPNIAAGLSLGFISHLYDRHQHSAFEQQLRSWLSAQPT
jgi:glucose-1-phosphatase